MLNRNIVSKNFRYRSNEFNFRLGFPEEKTVKIGALYTRIDYWKNVYFKFLKLSPFDNIMFYMNQSGFDTFAMVLAATELDLNIVSENPDLIIHTLPDSALDTTGFDKHRNYSYYDLADHKFESDVKYTQIGTSTVIGKTTAPAVSIHGNVLHTKYNTDPELIIDFMLPALMSDTVETHSCLGFNDVVEGMHRILAVVQMQGINCVQVPSMEIYYIFVETAWLKNVNIDNLRINCYDNGVITPVINPDTIGYNELEDLPNKYRVRGKILKDITEDKIYFQFTHPVDESIAKIKVSTMNAEVERKTGQKISKWAYAEGPADEAVIMFRNLNSLG